MTQMKTKKTIDLTNVSLSSLIIAGIALVAIVAVGIMLSDATTNENSNSRVNIFLLLSLIPIIVGVYFIIKHKSLSTTGFVLFALGAYINYGGSIGIKNMLASYSANSAGEMIVRTSSAYKILVGMKNTGIGMLVAGVLFYGVGMVLKKPRINEELEIAEIEKQETAVVMPNISSDTKFCRSCGTSSPYDSQFCQKCGTAFV